MDDYTGLIINKGGIVTDRQWVYDEELEQGNYVVMELESDQELTKLMSNCILAEDVTLKDILLILQKNIDVYSVIINNWVEEIVVEGLSEPLTRDTECEYLELYWNMIELVCDGVSSFSGHEFPDFHGWGAWSDSSGALTGTKGGMSLMFSPVNEIAHLPLKLNTETFISQENLDVNWSSLEELAEQTRESIQIDKCSYTLFHILYAIPWELSFSGSPEDRNKKADELKLNITTIKDNL